MEDEILDVATIPQTDTSDDFLDIKFNHTPMVISKDNARELAQKGLNYDKVFAKLTNLENNALSDTPSAENENILENKIDDNYSGELNYFFEKFSNVDPRDIPEEVINEYGNGTPLHIAYESHLLKQQISTAISELETLKDEFLMDNSNKQNASNSTGSISSDSVSNSEFYTDEQLSNLSNSEIKNNLDKAIRSMTFISKQNKQSYYK